MAGKSFTQTSFDFPRIKVGYVLFQVSVIMHNEHFFSHIGLTLKYKRANNYTRENKPIHKRTFSKISSTVYHLYLSLQRESQDGVKLQQYVNKSVFFFLLKEMALNFLRFVLALFSWHFWACSMFTGNVQSAICMLDYMNFLFQAKRTKAVTEIWIHDV